MATTEKDGAILHCRVGLAKGSAASSRGGCHQLYILYIPSLKLTVRP